MNWDKYSSDEERSEKDKASNVKQKQKEDDVSEYTDKEVEYIDRYLPMAKNALDESELYDLIIEYKFNDARIEEEIKHRLKLIEAKGDDYGWTEVKKKAKKAPNQKQEKTNDKKDIKQKKNYKKDNANEYNKKKNYNAEKQNDNKEEGDKEEGNNYNNEYYNNKPYYNNYNRRYNNGNYRNNYNNNYYNNGYTKQYNNNYNNNYNSRYYNNNNRNYNNNYNRYNNNNRYHNNYNNYYNNKDYKQRKEEVEIAPPKEDNQNTITEEVSYNHIEEPQPSETIASPPDTQPNQEETPKVDEPISPQSSYAYIDISNAALFSIEPTKNAKQVSSDPQSSTSSVKITGDPKPDVNQLYMDYNYNIMNNYYQYMNPSMYYQYQMSQGRGMNEYYGYPNMNYMMYAQMMNQQKYGSSYYQPKKNVPSKTVYHQDSATKEPEKK